MDSLAALKVLAAPPGTGATRPVEASAANKGMKAMELAVESAVAPAQRSAKSVLDTQRQGSAAAGQADSAHASHTVTRTVRNIEFDPITRDVIFQSISSETGVVVAQVPTEQQLKIRHYTRNGGEMPPPQPSRIA